MVQHNVLSWGCQVNPHLQTGIREDILVLRAFAVWAENFVLDVDFEYLAHSFCCPNTTKAKQKFWNALAASARSRVLEMHVCQAQVVAQLECTSGYRSCMVPAWWALPIPGWWRGCSGQQGRKAVVVVVVRYSFCGVKSDSNSICLSATSIIQGRKIAMDLIFGSKYLEVQYTSRAWHYLKSGLA